MEIVTFFRISLLSLEKSERRETEYFPSVTARVELVCSQEPGVCHLDLPHECRVPKNLGHLQLLSQTHYQGAGLEVVQLGVKPASCMRCQYHRLRLILLCHSAKHKCLSYTLVVNHYQSITRRTYNKSKHIIHVTYSIKWLRNLRRH